MDWRWQAHQQNGVISRTQLLDVGLAEHEVRRLVRRRELAPVHRGVFLTHTGAPTWRQRAWAGVLYAAPAALWGPSALAAGRGSFAPTEVVHVAIDESRRVAAPAGVVVHRVKGLGVRTHWRTAPPRMRAGEAVLDAALAEDEFGQVAVLARAVQERVVTPQEISVVLESRTPVPRRRFLLALLDDLASGTDSVLEHGYLTRVERAHGLPRGRRQGRVVGLREHRDVLYEEARAIVELDSRAYHSLARQRYADLERDTSALVAGYQTVRIGWGQVFGTPCRTAALLTDLFGQRGWGGTARRCPACP